MTYRVESHDLDGQGSKPTRVYDLTPVLIRQDTTTDPYLVPEFFDYWRAVTDVPCPVCQEGELRWAEAGYVPGYRICSGCGRHFLASGNAEKPTVLRVGNRRSAV